MDTHLDVHVAAAVDGNGGVLGVESFATTTVGFAELCDWFAGFGPLARVGVEGTGAYGAGVEYAYTMVHHAPQTAQNPQVVPKKAAH